MTNNSKNRTEVAQDLGKFLCRLEETTSAKDFLNKLLEQQELDPANFRVGSAAIPGEDLEMPVVIGGHGMLRARRRLGLTPSQVLELATRCLKNPFVGAEVVLHPTVWDAENNCVASTTDDGVTNIIVIDEDERYTLALQAGYSFVLVRTVWDNFVGNLKVGAGQMILRVRGTGEVSREIIRKRG